MNKQFTDKQLDLISRIANHNGMDCWLSINHKGEFKDLEKGRKMSPKTAIRDLLDGLVREDWEDLSGDEKWELLQIAQKVTY